MSLYLVTNGPMPTTAAQAVVTTGTAIKTMLQVKPLAIARIRAWGISFKGFAAAEPVKCELMEADVAATVTASVEADITKYDDPVNALAADVMTLSTTGTGYTASVEGTITVVRPFDIQLVAPSSQYVLQYPLGMEPKIQKNKFGRIRVHAPAAVDCYCWMLLDI